MKKNILTILCFVLTLSLANLNLMKANASPDLPAEKPKIDWDKLGWNNEAQEEKSRRSIGHSLMKTCQGLFQRIYEAEILEKETKSNIKKIIVEYLKLDAEEVSSEEKDCTDEYLRSELLALLDLLKATKKTIEENRSAFVAHSCGKVLESENLD